MAGHEDALRELDLVLDEEEPVKVKVGTSLWHLSMEEAKELTKNWLAKEAERLQVLKQEFNDWEGQAEALKGPLKAKFGEAIRLDA